MIGRMLLIQAIIVVCFLILPAGVFQCRGISNAGKGCTFAR